MIRGKKERRTRVKKIIVKFIPLAVSLVENCELHMLVNCFLSYLAMSLECLEFVLSRMCDTGVSPFIVACEVTVQSMASAVSCRREEPVLEAHWSTSLSVTKFKNRAWNGTCACSLNGIIKFGYLSVPQFWQRIVGNGINYCFIEHSTIPL